MHINKGYLSGKLYKLKMNEFNGKKVANFVLRQWSKGSDGTEYTDFFEFEAWDKAAEWVEKVFKEGIFAVVEYRVKVRKNKTTNYDEIVLVAQTVDFQPKDKPAEAGSDDGQEVF